MVLPLDSTGFGLVFPQNLPLEKEKEDSQDQNRLQTSNVFHFLLIFSWNPPQLRLPVLLMCDGTTAHFELLGIPLVCLSA